MPGLALNKSCYQVFMLRVAVDKGGAQSGMGGSIEDLGFGCPVEVERLAKRGVMAKY
ncbi:hypothetical protein GCM10027180_14530 [Microbulbifer echini]